ncbi:MAG: cadherin repeat domain-containing protein, partial [Candidatus Thorarchaeota archaeon]
TVHDTFNNYRSERITIIVTESEAPTWIVIPEDQIVELGSDLSYDLQVYDYSGISSYSLSNDANFQINTEGVLTNALPLQVGVYELEVWVTDTVGNTASATFNIIVEDTTPPIWIQGPENKGFIIGEHLQMQLSAWDMSGIGAWAVSDEIQFQIDNNGLLRDTDDMHAGVHYINVTVFDIYGNGLTTQFVVVVRAVEAGGPNISVAAIVVLGVTGVVIAVMLSTFCLIRRRDIAIGSVGSTGKPRAPRGGKKKK